MKRPQCSCVKSPSLRCHGPAVPMKYTFPPALVTDAENNNPLRVTLKTVSKLLADSELKRGSGGILAADKRRSGTVLPQLRFQSRIHLVLNKHMSKLHGQIETTACFRNGD